MNCFEISLITVNVDDSGYVQFFFSNTERILKICFRIVFGQVLEAY